MKRLLQLLVRFVSNERERGRRLYLIWKYHYETHVRRAWLGVRVVQ